VVAERKPKDVPELQWVNTVLGNLKNGLIGSYHGFGFRKYAAQYPGRPCLPNQPAIRPAHAAPALAGGGAAVQPAPAVVDSVGG